MKVFRDCGSNQNGGYDDPAELSIGTSDGGYFMESFEMYNPVITNLSNLFSNPCLAVPPNVCVQQAVYTRTIDLPIDLDNSYYIIYQRCCRNNSIFNILSPGDVGATYYTEITPKAQTLHNSSPTFKTIPPIAVCGNFALSFDHAAEDKDGDSLAYYMVSPITGGGNNSFGNMCEQIIPNPDCLPPYDSVTFRPPFSGQNPMGGSPAVTIDSKTGLLTGTPNATGQFVVGVRVDEYRNGELLSSTIRDFQFNVADCEKVVKAAVSTKNETGRKIEFRFCGDEYAEIENQSTLAASIFNYTWQVSRNGVDSIYTSKDLSLDILDFGVYEGTMILNKGLQCTDTAFFKFTKFPGIDPDFTYSYDTCKTEGVKFTSTSTSETNLALTPNWTMNNVSFGTSNTVLSGFPSPGNYPVVLKLTDPNMCVDSITRIVSYFPIPDKILSLKDINGCVPATVTFKSPHELLNNTYTVTWDFGDGQTGEGLTPTHTYSAIDDYDIKVHAVDAAGCEYDGIFNDAVKVHDNPVAGFDYTPRELSNLKPTIEITDKSLKSQKWLYDFGTGDISETPNPTYVFADTGFFIIKQLVKNKDGCFDSTFVTVDVTPINTIFLPNAFLPATQGENEAFGPVGNGFGIVSYSMSIFDRYGEEVFKTTDFNERWDGTTRSGKNLPNGNYAVKVRIEGPRGSTKELYGSALLLR